VKTKTNTVPNTVPKYRAGALDNNSKTHGSYVIVQADSRAQAMLDVRKHFPNVPITRLFAFDAEPGDKVDGQRRPFTIPAKGQSAR